MNCNDVHAKMADLLFDVEERGAVIAGKADGVQEHLAGCEGCRKELAELRSALHLLDAWEAPEPNPYFLTRFNARLDEEREAAPASWFEKVRARLVYGSRLGLRPVAAMALTVMVLVGGGAYLGLSDLETPAVQTGPQAAVVQDLQTMDSNAQLLDQLETLSSQNND
jgi:hypothetical protein